jgi:hypothetical protein
MANNTTLFTENISSHDLMETMRNFKGTVKEREKFAPIVRKYINNYDTLIIKKEIMSIVKKDIDIDTTDIMWRFEHMRILLAFIIPNVTRIVCVTLKIDIYNFAYIYFQIDTKTIKPLFFSIGENLISSDGEWRSHVMDIGTYDILISKYGKYIENILPEEEIVIEIFYSSTLTDQYTDQINKYMDERDYKQKFFALARFSIKMDTQQIHVDPNFIKKLDGPMPYIPQDIANDMYLLISSILSNIPIYPNKKIFYNPVAVGQKLLILNIDGISRPLYNKNKAWKELEISRRTTDLVLNNITPCFAIHGAWFFIYNANKNLFNSSLLKTKIELYSDILQDIDENEILSDVAISLINENVGKTFINNLPTNNIERSVFDIIFALYCMNVKLKLMHCDLHCNNVTRFINIPCDEWIIYNVSGVEYIFPHDGYYSCIIDFSRSLDIKSIDIIEKSIQKYETHFPSWLKDNLEKIFQIHTDSIDNDTIENIVKIMSVFDIYEFSKSVLSLKNICIDLEILMKKICEEACIILKSIINIKQKDVLEWGNLVLIRKIFSTGTTVHPKKIYGYYTDLNEMKYSILDYKCLPRSFIDAPMIENDNDILTPTHSAMTLSIKMKYVIMKDSENLMTSLQ